MDKLHAVEAAAGTLLDHTVLLLGGSQISSHSGSSFPMLLAGGDKLGFKYGQHVNWKGDQRSASDLYREKENSPFSNARSASMWRSNEMQLRASVTHTAAGCAGSLNCFGVVDTNAPPISRFADAGHAHMGHEGIVRAVLPWPGPRCRFDGAVAEVSFTACSWAKR